MQKIHNSIESPPEKGGPKESRYEEDNIIIIDSTMQ